MKAFLTVIGAALMALPAWAGCEYWAFVRPPSLEGHQVHVWVGSFSEISSNGSVLSPEEKQRVARTPVKERSIEFEKSRVFLRGILSGYLSVPPAQVPISVTSLGKPFLPPESALQFNLSNSGEKVAVGVIGSKGWPGAGLGIDLEKVKRREERDWTKLAPFVMTPSEQARLEQLRKGDAAAATKEFYRVWTMKEAVLKAMGTGINGRNLSQFSVIDSEGRLSLQGAWGIRHYRVETREIEGGYQVAVALISEQSIPVPAIRIFTGPTPVK